MTAKEEVQLALISQILMKCDDPIIVHHLPLSKDTLYAHPEIIDGTIDYLTDYLCRYGFDGKYAANQDGMDIEGAIGYIMPFRADYD